MRPVFFLLAFLSSFLSLAPGAESHEPTLTERIASRIVEAYLFGGAPGIIDAIEEGDIDKIRKFLRENPEQINDNHVCGGYTLLQAAAGAGQLEIVQLLIDNKASVMPKAQKINQGIL